MKGSNNYMFKCKNMQNSRSKCYQMQIQGKVCFCRDAKSKGYEGCKKICIHIVPATGFTINSYPIAIFTCTLSFISTVCGRGKKRGTTCRGYDLTSIP